MPLTGDVHTDGVAEILKHAVLIKPVSFLDVCEQGLREKKHHSEDCFSNVTALVVCVCV